MELRNFLQVLRRGWLIILVLTLLGAGAGVALTLLTTKTYESTVRIFVAGSDTQATNENAALQGANAFTQDRTAAYPLFAKSQEVTDKVAADLASVQTRSNPPFTGVRLSGNDIARMVTATVDDSKVVIDLTADAGNPRVAQFVAASSARYFIKAVQDGETKTLVPSVNNAGAPLDEDGNPTAESGKEQKVNELPVVNLSIVFDAKVPTTPVSPRPVLNIGLGLLVGLFLGLGIVILRDVLDNTLKGPGDFEKVGIPVLGTVPFDRRATRSPIAFRTDPHSARSEAYRALRTNMQFVDVDNPPHVIVVTSAMPNEGKTTTSINLASALAEAGYRVCLIDADLRRPSVADALGLVGDVGFTSVLISDTPVEDVLQNAGRNLAVLTSGPVPPNPSELLLSEHARAVLADIASKVDYCVIDTPPLLPVTDAAELSTIADATLIVARAGKTTTEQSKRSIQALEKVGEKPVGVILNMISQSSGSDDRYGYYYAPYRPDRDSRKLTKQKDKDQKEKDATAEKDVAAVEVVDADSPAAVTGAAPAATEAATEEKAENEPARSGLLN